MIVRDAKAATLIYTTAPTISYCASKLTPMDGDAAIIFGIKTNAHLRGRMMVETGQLKAPSDWQTDRDPINVAVIGKLIEELGELQSALARCLIQGIEESHPVTGKPNRQWLEEELDDVAAMTLLLSSHFGTKASYDRITEKLRHKTAWLKLIRS